MRRLYFATDGIRFDALIRYLEACWAAGAAQGWYALLDQAFDAPKGSPDWGFPRHGLYAEPPLNQLRESGPLLLELGGPGVLRGPALRQLWAHTLGRPMLSFLKVAHGIDALPSAWRHALEVHLDDGQSFVLRLADTRVLEYLPRCLKPGHWAMLRHPVEQWWFVDRTGCLQALPGVQAGTEPAADFTLDEQEWSALIDAGLPDAVISILHDQAPELLPRDRRAAFHAEVQATCELAHRHGIQAMPDLVALAAACAMQPSLREDARLHRLLDTQDPTAAPLAQRLAALWPQEVA